MKREVDISRAIKMANFWELGWSYARIARQFGCTRNTVAGCIDRLRKRGHFVKR